MRVSAWRCVSKSANRQCAASWSARSCASSRPGRSSKSTLLHSPANNFLVALVLGEDGAGLAAADVSTGILTCTMAQGDGWRELIQAELARLAPAECVTVDESVSHDPRASARRLSGDGPTGV